MTPQSLQPEDLMELAEALRRAGYDIGTQQHVAAEDLVIALAAHGRLPADPRAWRGLLAPIFCSSPAEQEDFRLHFEQWLARRPALARQVEADSIQSAMRPRWYRLPKLLGAVGAALLAAIVVAVHLSMNTTFMLKGKITSGEDRQPLAGAKIYFDASTQPILTDDNGEFAISYQATRLSVLRRKASKRFKVEHPGYLTRQHLVDEHPPPYRDIALQKQKGSPVKPERDPPATPPGGEPPTPAPTPVQPSPDWRDSRWMRAALASLPLLLFALWRLWRRYRRRMILQKLQSAGSPHLDRIVVKGASEKLFQGPAIRRAIQELRRHRRMQSSELDVPGAVRATIRRAGMFAPVYGMRKTMPEYLLLVERAGPHDAQARLAGEISQRLEAGGVFVDRYEFQHDPRTCRRPEPASPTLTLHELAARHPDHCLLIFSDGAGLISPVTGEPERWIESFAYWEHRALLTPEAPGCWREREQMLAETISSCCPPPKTAWPRSAN
ncbi:MAG: hypothetical protein ACREEM_32110 [Blastocatellia bacterium]